MYNLRWGIETSFRDIKYAAGLLFFHSKSKELVLQEIYAKIILYNFSELVTQCVVIQKGNTKYHYQINFSSAISICMEFLRRSYYLCNLPPLNVAALLSKELIAISPNRSYPRYIRARTATTFQYR